MSHLPEYFEHLVNDRGLTQNQAADRLALVQNAFASDKQRKWYFAGGPGSKASAKKGGKAGRTEKTGEGVLWNAPDKKQFKDRMEDAEKKLAKLSKNDYIESDELFAGSYDQEYSVAGSEFQQRGESVDVPLKGLRATQGFVYSPGIKKFIENPSAALGAKGDRDETLPNVVKYRGRHYVHDGHTRIAAYALLGAEKVKARLIDLDKTE